jgi:hypothetical protein
VGTCININTVMSEMEVEVEVDVDEEESRPYVSNSKMSRGICGGMRG